MVSRGEFSSRGQEQPRGGGDERGMGTRCTRVTRWREGRRINAGQTSVTMYTGERGGPGFARGEPGCVNPR